jgi:hypothetical protein
MRCILAALRLGFGRVLVGFDLARWGWFGALRAVARLRLFLLFCFGA